MSSPDDHSPWGTPGHPPARPAARSRLDRRLRAAARIRRAPGSAADDVPLRDAAGRRRPKGPAVYGTTVSGGHGPGSGGPGDGGRRRKTLIASALAVVAVVGIGGAVAFMSGGSSKPDTASPAGSRAPRNPAAPAPATARRCPPPAASPTATHGGASTNGAQGADVPRPPRRASGGPDDRRQPGRSTAHRRPRQPGVPATRRPGLRRPPRSRRPAARQAQHPGHHRDAEAGQPAVQRLHLPGPAGRRRCPRSRRARPTSTRSRNSSAC